MFNGCNDVVRHVKRQFGYNARAGKKEYIYIGRIVSCTGQSAKLAKKKLGDCLYRSLAAGKVSDMQFCFSFFFLHVGASDQEGLVKVGVEL